MKNSRAKSKTARLKTASAHHAQPRRNPRTPHGLIERKGPFRNLIEIPGMKGRTLERVEIYTATGHHSLTLDFEDKTSLSLVLDPCFFISAELSDISSGSERTLKRWPTIKSITGGQ